ncbi:hypothetical protein LIER_09019 [Lithospermum erythrorhizon]|uniref:Protein PAM68, chloroplastic n=1 Tax=Lithospermum erythrorhizon TaxID=34254 RepID=A0AAV3PG61_LITER
METCSLYPRAPILASTPTKKFLLYPSSISTRNSYQIQFGVPRLTSISATLNSPKGFGPSTKKSRKPKKTKKGYEDDEDEEEDEEEDEDEEDSDTVIPEIVTNRMISRMGLSVGIPLFVGLLFFPFFYYLKVGLKIDVPTFIPVIVSFIFFGTALLGVSYGIVSSSWDPLREGSLLGWNEAKKNWPVFWQSFWGGSRKK